MRIRNVFKRLNACILLCLVILLHVGVMTAQNTSPLCFTARNGSVTVRFDIKNVTHTIQYSTNGSTWSTYTSNTNILINANKRIFFRASANQIVARAFGSTYISGCSRFYFSSSNDGTIEGSGNIMSLYGPDCPNLPLQQYAFNYMFYECTSLTTTPELPATTLADCCYRCMFYGCSLLITVPELPATSLAWECYKSMFYGCSSLCVNTSFPGKMWIIPAISSWSAAFAYMLTGTGGTMHSEPSVNTTYYIASWPQHNITVSENDSTMGSVSGAGFYYFGDVASLTVLPIQNYHFTNWSDGDITNPRDVTVVSDSLFTAVFAPNKYTVYINDSNGTLAGTGTYLYNTTITLTAIPNEHYHFVSWPDGDTANVKSFIVNADTTFTSLFEIDKHTITANCEHGTVTGCGQYNYGTIATLTATANQHYHFARWSDGNTSNPRNVTVNGDASYTAIFEGDLQTITANGQNGTVTGGGQHNYGTTATLTAIPNEHYHFAKWSDCNTSNPRVVTVNGDALYTAIFEGDLQIITANGQNGTITGDGQYNYGTTATLTATGNIHYHFAKWMDGDTSNPRIINVCGDSTFAAIFEPNIYSVSSNNHLVAGIGEYDYGSMVTLIAHSEEHERFVQWADGTTDSVHSFILSSGDTTIIAFYDLDSFNIKASCDYGTVTGADIYGYKDIVTLYVEPYQGYRFVAWSDSNKYNPRVFVVEGDLTVEAICEEAPVVGIEEVRECVTFYYVDGKIVNPEGGMLRVYSTNGKLMKSGDGNIATEGWPAGVYVVVDEKGRALKIVVR